MFDPYHKWLGIPPNEQPANHYRLLGVQLYEKDLDVIEGAADRAMGFVRQYQSGEHAALAAKLLNEIAVARLCLLKPKSKADYDAKLKREVAAKEAAKDETPAFVDDAEVAALMRASKSVSKKKKRKSESLPANYLIAGGVGAVALILVVVISSRMGGKSHITLEPGEHAAAGTDEKSSLTKEPGKPQASSKSNISLMDSKLVDEAVGPPVNLIEHVDLKRDTFAGEWKKEGTSLIGGTGGKIYLPTKLPNDYQLKFGVKRVAENETLLIGFVMAGRLGTVALDANGSSLSGLYLDGHDPDANCTTRRGTLFENDRLSTIIMTIHPGHLHVSCDGQTIVDWHGTPDRLFLNSDQCVPNRESAYMGIAKGSYQIESAVMIPIKSEPEAARVAKLGGPLDLMPLLNTERDAKRGVWTLDKNVLLSPETNFAQFCLPVSVPKEYTLSATIELPKGFKGEPAFMTGMLAGDTYFTVALIQDKYLGIERIDGFRSDKNETRLSGAFLVPGKPVKMSTTVTRNLIRMELDGRTLIHWTGDFRRLSVPADWAPIDGRKLFIGTTSYFKISDVQLGPPVDPPKYLWHPEFKAGQPVDLLAMVDLKRDALEGVWERDGGALRVTGKGTAVSKFVIPCEIPSEYKLTIRVTREAGGSSDNEGLVLKLPTPSSMAQVVLDASASTISAIALDRINMDDQKNPSINHVKAIPPGQSEEFVVYVRRTGIKVMKGDKAIIDWTGNVNRCHQQGAWATPGGQIAIGSSKSRFKFEKLEIEPLEPSSFPAVPPLGADGNVLAIIDPVRDSRRGQWKSDPNGLVSPSFPGHRLAIPVMLPERYLFAVDVERKKGTSQNNQFCIGLVVGGHPCNIVLDGGRPLAALERLDDKSFNDKLNFTRQEFQQPLLPKKRVKVRCLVLPDTVVVMCGDKKVVSWHGDPRRLSLDHSYLPPNYSDADRSQLWLGGGGDSEFLIRDLKLRPLTDEEVAKIADKMDQLNSAESK